MSSMGSDSYVWSPAAIARSPPSTTSTTTTVRTTLRAIGSPLTLAAQSRFREVPLREVNRARVNLGPRGVGADEPKRDRLVHSFSRPLHGHGGGVEVGAVPEALNLEMERVGGPNTLLEPPHAHAVDVEVAVERAVGARVADQSDGTVAAPDVKDAIPAAGEWRREVDRGGMVGPWPPADRVHGAPGDPGAHANGQG